MSRKQELKKLTTQLAIWTALWIISTAVATFGSLLVWPEHYAVKVALLLINITVGAVMINVNRRYVLALDELQQKVFLQAMGITLGVAVIGGITYSLADITDVISGDAEISVLIMVLGITYLISMFVGMRSYR
ncbi:hypothetical protein ACFOD1_03420 [Pseudidiomarina halophila]|uniref:Uncharacterized protein n=1 Tax=Pseudidiomarina halophila TaxID=1449799 RepID=A0A432XZ23_9GAMM|nr:hypothetical protein [Pseudidiomarina halophila]RUO53998.1 hypothetical protein CWI69_00760 [Pseudidiomarina halophila]